MDITNNVAKWGDDDVYLNAPLVYPDSENSSNSESCAGSSDEEWDEVDEHGEEGAPEDIDTTRAQEILGEFTGCTHGLEKYLSCLCAIPSK